jgi:queuine tRNA-ribosyltransferase
MEIQRLLGSDIQMVFDECPALPATHAAIEKSMALSMRWAKRSKDRIRQQTIRSVGRACFGIVQGGTFADLRVRSAEALQESDLTAMRWAGLRSASRKARCSKPWTQPCRTCLRTGRVI